MKFIKTIKIILVFIFLILSSFKTTYANDYKANAQETSLLKPLELDPTKLEAFIDGIINAELKAGKIAGVTFSFVKDGQIILAKGYGFSDVKNKVKVSPDQTLFRPGSVSKLITWTAVMQLIEQGKIDLNTDINEYLSKFKITNPFGQLITMAHLMSHTPGFEEVIGQMLVKKPEELISLEDYLILNMPHCIYPPGKIPAYSNYGTALAGYIVEVVSGQKFEDYVEENIFKPIGMERSTFREPLPQELVPFMSKGYTLSKGVFKEHDFELFNGLYPAGSMSSTAVDMAKFIIAHLQGGKLGDNRILKEESVNLMHSQLYTADPRLNGNAHGFWEIKWNGLRIIEHGGDTIYFHSHLVLFPEHNMGYFVSMNTGGAKTDLRGHLLEAFLERYFPLPENQEVKSLNDFQSRAKELVGSYSLSRAVASKFYKATYLLSQIAVSVTPENTLYVTLPGGLGSNQFKEIEPYFFQEIGGYNKILFKKDDRGKIRYLYFNKYPFMIGIKVRWFEKKSFVQSMMIICLILMVSTLGWFLTWLLRKIRCRPQLTEKPHPLPRWCLGIGSFCLLIFFIGLVSMISNESSLMSGITPGLKILFSLPIIALPFVVGSIVFVWLSWKRKYWTWCSRLHYLLVVLATIITVWILNTWNLLGWKF